ncbi:hypothetical protein GALL_256870 [mine drainage metagenome]|uniref:Uncharacterized protein n=1 Tax=mine drainage metagenome TaxID=410659 RepID=A0A1J5RSC2_9ZZZZ
MFKFLGKALSGLLLTDTARKAVRQGGAAAPAKGRAAAKAPAAKAAGKEKAISEAREQAKGLLTEDRAELIRQAMKVRAAKQTILADLSDEDRAKLVAAAMKALLNEGRDKKG